MGTKKSNRKLQSHEDPPSQSQQQSESPNMFPPIQRPIMSHNTPTPPCEILSNNFAEIALNSSSANVSPLLTSSQRPTPKPRYHTRGQKRALQAQLEAESGSRSLAQSSSQAQIQSQVQQKIPPPQPINQNIPSEVGPSFSFTFQVAYPSATAAIHNEHRRVARIRSSSRSSPLASRALSPHSGNTPRSTPELEDSPLSSPVKRMRINSGSSLNKGFVGVVWNIPKTDDIELPLSDVTMDQIDVEDDYGRSLNLSTSTTRRRESQMDRSPLHKVFAESRSTSVPISPTIASPQPHHQQTPMSPQFLPRRITEPSIPSIGSLATQSILPIHQRRLMKQEENIRTELDKVFSLGYGRGLGAKLGVDSRRRGSGLRPRSIEDNEELKEAIDMDQDVEMA